MTNITHPNYRDYKPLQQLRAGLMFKEEANYTPDSAQRKCCQNCTYSLQQVKSKRYICSQITGEIKLTGICKLWKG